MADEDTTDEQTDEDREVEEQMKAVEEDPPKDLDDWPGGKAKYKTMGGPDGEAGYHDGPTEKLGPTDLEYKEDGSIEIEGEAVDNPDDYRGDPIPGGPSDTDAPPNQVPGTDEPDDDGEADAT